ncbi:MAG: Ig-like domain-containing protein [Clostridia bacterium]|nr:Ig-like domain-containing protein [Clostridia bacterium]
MRKIWKTTTIGILSVLAAATVFAACGENPSSSTGESSGSSGSSTPAPAPITFTIDYKTDIVYKEYEAEFTAYLTQGAAELETSEIEWSVENTAVATVNGGVVTGVGLGETKLTAKTTYEGKEYLGEVTITVEELATYLASATEEVLATTVTYGGKTNENAVDSQIVVKKLVGKTETEVSDLSSITFTSSDEAIAKVVNGKIVAGEKAGTATITLTDGVATGEFKVEVYTALASKFDLDMLALAYARGVNAEAWGVNARYVLANDIDYDGEIFLPIAAHTGRSVTYRLIGKQWENVLAEGNDYGLSYEEFVKTGLNAAFTTSGTANTVFRGCLDGNGHTLKNAKLMLDAAVSTRSGFTGEGSSIIFTTHFIGCMGNGGKLKNIAVQNFGLQTAAEAGYEFNKEIKDGLPKIGENEGREPAIMPDYYKANCLGLIGGGEGTLENVYLEMTGVMDKPVVPCGFECYTFGNWTGITNFKGCVFVDGFTDNDAGTDGTTKAMQVSSSGSLEVDTFALVSGLKVQGKIVGEYLFEKTVEEVKQGIADGKYALNSDGKVWAELI